MPTTIEIQISENFKNDKMALVNGRPSFTIHSINLFGDKVNYVDISVKAMSTISLAEHTSKKINNKNTDESPALPCKITFDKNKCMCFIGSTMILNDGGISAVHDLLAAANLQGCIEEFTVINASSNFYTFMIGDQISLVRIVSSEEINIIMKNGSEIIAHE